MEMFHFTCFYQTNLSNKSISIENQSLYILHAIAIICNSVFKGSSDLNHFVTNGTIRTRSIKNWAQKLYVSTHAFAQNNYQAFK